MKITVTFDGIKELLATLRLSEADIMTAALNCTKDPEKKTPEPVPVVIKTAAPAPAPAPASEPEPVPDPEPTQAPEAPAPAVDESYRLEVRKVLSKLNALARQAGSAEKPAQKIISAMGYERLTEVPLDRLTELMGKAKEALDGAAQ